MPSSSPSRASTARRRRSTARPLVVGAGTRSEGGPAFGGDVAVMLHDTPAARRFMLFLASRDAAEPWVRAGGFTSPSIRVTPEMCPDDASREMAKALENAERIPFDFSDQLPPELGSDPERGQWLILRDFLRNPDRVDEVARRLQEACLAAGLKCGGG